MQGAFAEHEASLDKLHIPHFEIRQADDLQDDMDGLIIPGGESTVMGKLLKELSLYEPLKAEDRSRSAGIRYLRRLASSGKDMTEKMHLASGR